MNGQQRPIQPNPTFNIGKGQFDKDRLTYFFRMMLKFGYVGLALWAVFALANVNFDFMKFLGSESFVYILVFAILGWVANSMLSGNFNPPKQDPNKPKMKWHFDPTGGKGRRPQQRPQYQQIQYPKLKQTQRKSYPPRQLQYGSCYFCGRQYVLSELRTIQQQDGTVIYVCRSCLR